MAAESSIQIPTAQALGKRIHAAMEAKGMKPIHLAVALDVSLSTMRRYLEGTTEPTYRQVVTLAELLERPLDWFITATP